MEEESIDDDYYNNFSLRERKSYTQGYLQGIKSWWSNTKKAWEISYSLDREIFFIGILSTLGGAILPTILLLFTRPVLNILKNGPLDQKLLDTYMPILLGLIVIYMVYIFVKPYILLYLRKRYKLYPLKEELFVKDVLSFIPYEYAIHSEKSFKVSRFESFIDELFMVTKTQIGAIISVFLICLGFSIGIGIDPVFTIWMVLSALFSLYNDKRISIKNFHHQNSDDETILKRRNNSISDQLNFPLLSTRLSNQVFSLTNLFIRSKTEILNRDIDRQKNSILIERKNGLFDTLTKICILVYIVIKIKQGGVFDVLAAFYISDTIVNYIKQFGSQIIEQNELNEKLLFVSDILDLSKSEKKLDELKISPDTSNGITIQFDNVSFYYPSKIENYVFKNMTFELNLDRLYGLQGDNGNGKTTLFKLITGYLNPTSGTIRINNIDVSKIKRSWFINNFSAYSPEMEIIGPLSIAEFLTTDCMQEYLDKNDLEIMNQILAEVGLVKKIVNADIQKLFLSPKHPDGTDFSSGQAQRLLIARMLMNIHYGAKYVFVDEMTSNISFQDQKKLAILLKKYCKGGILIAHNPQMIEVCDEVLVCKNETIIIEKQEVLIA